MWANIGASAGTEKALKLRDAVARKMTPDQIAEAQGLAHECIRKKYERCSNVVSRSAVRDDYDQTDAYAFVACPTLRDQAKRLMRLKISLVPTEAEHRKFNAVFRELVLAGMYRDQERTKEITANIGKELGRRIRGKVPEARDQIMADIIRQCHVLANRLNTQATR